MTIKTVPAIIVRIGASLRTSFSKKVPVIASRIRASFRTPASSFCSNTESFAWFPVQQGLTSLPAAPNKAFNPNPVPVNAVEVPADWDDSDMCRLFQDILPRYIDPIYSVELFSTRALRPYSEALPVEAVVRLGVVAESFPYTLGRSSQPITVSVRTTLSESRRFPVDVLLRVETGLNFLVDLETARTRRLSIGVKIVASNEGVSAPAVALLHMDGFEGSTNFVDEIGNSWTSQFAKITYAKSKIGLSVGDFTTPTSSVSCTDASLDIDNYNFTLEFWFYLTAVTSANRYLFSAGREGIMAEDYGIYIYNRSFYYRYWDGSSIRFFAIETLSVDPINGWYHIAISRSGYDLRGYINGVATSYIGVTPVDKFGTGSLKIGNSSDNKFITGYIDEFRLIKGAGIYVGESFTLPSQPYEPAPAINGARLVIKSKIIASLEYINRVSETTLRIKTDAFYTTGYNFKPVEYTGNGTSRTVSDLGFRPSFVWIKTLTASGYGVNIFDTLRGALKGGSFSTSHGETTLLNTLTSFSSYGFTVGSHVSVNQSTTNYCGWVFGGNQSVRSFKKQTVADGFITESTFAMVESDAISYGYYSSNGTGSGVSTGVGSYVYHGFSSEPDAILCTGVDNSSYSECRMVGALLGDNYSVRMSSSFTAEQGTVSLPVYLNNLSRPGYVRLGGTLDSGTDKRYVYHAFKSKPGKVYAGSHAGSSSTDTRIDTGFRPVMIIAKMIYTAGAPAAPAYSFDAVKGWNLAIPWSIFSSPINAYSLDVDELGFTVKKNSTISTDGTVWVYIAFAGTLVSPLGGVGAIISVPPVSTQVNAQVPAIEIAFRGALVSIPLAAIGLRANYMPLAARGSSISLEGDDAILITVTPLPSELGEFTCDGLSANLLRGFRLPASAGTCAVQGVAATTSAEDYFSRWSSQTYGFESLVLPALWTD